ncbi:MAG: DUF4177 domain-containing protein [Acidobacteria bacterium]|nr:DUF4177 domain-containing protein [Acidobacteriota bacterium]
MKNKIWFAVNLFLLAMVVLFTYNENATAGKKEMWEYKTRDGSLRRLVNKNGSPVNVINGEEVLNKFGDDGWELTAIEQKTDDDLGPIYIFKRKKD